MKETKIQQGIVKFLRYALPVGYVVFAVPNGGKRNKTTAAILKAEGVLAGVHDLIILGPKGAAALIEVKNEDGPLNKSQKDFHKHCKEYEVPQCVARSIGDVQSFLHDLGIISGAKIGA